MWYTMVAVLAFRWVFDNKAREVCQGREEGASRTKIGIRLEYWNHEHVGWVQHHTSPFGSKTSFWNHVALLWQDTFPSHGIFCSFLLMTILMMMNDDLIPDFCFCVYLNSITISNQFVWISQSKFLWMEKFSLLIMLFVHQFMLNINHELLFQVVDFVSCVLNEVLLFSHRFVSCVAVNRLGVRERKRITWAWILGQVKSQSHVGQLKQKMYNLHCIGSSCVWYNWWNFLLALLYWGCVWLFLAQSGCKGEHYRNFKKC